jgi:hypothetical protein
VFFELVEDDVSTLAVELGPRIAVERVRAARLSRLALLAATLVILALGAVECVYGNTDGGDIYGSDAVQYLDIARAMSRGDWHSALNPLWSQGYPAVLATTRPLFADGPRGDWADTRCVNFAIFAADYAAFLYLLMGLMAGGRKDSRRSTVLWVAALGLFFTTQVCFGQVSRVNPDELVTTFFFLACGMMVRLLRRAWIDDEGLVSRGLLLGLAIGVGFVVKAIFLGLGCGMFALLGLAMWRRRQSLKPVLAATVVFAVIVGSYGVALSKAVGKPTLGEAGSLNYAWHVNRLQKWVHWEGGVAPASEAWPKPWIARFAQWDTRPVDFGKPVHPSVILQEAPRVYGFAAPIHATYVPYYDPAYWYEGYKPVFRPRFQVIAVMKSVGDLAQSLMAQPMFYAVLAALGILLWRKRARREARRWVRSQWMVVACGALGVALYLPIHLEGRYLAGFLAALGVCGFVAALDSREAWSSTKFRAVMLVLALGIGGSLVRTQAAVWRNVLRHKAPEKNVEWHMGEAVLAQGLPAMSQVGVIAWTPNLHCDWAYIAHLQITSEIGSVEDFNMFWKLAPGDRAKTLANFRNAGAVAVFSYGKPEGVNANGWTQMGSTSLWMYRL